MSDNISIHDPEPFAGNLLPYNYLPAAFSQLASPHPVPDKPGRIVFLLSNSGSESRKAVEYHVVPGSVLANPDEFSVFLKDRQFSDGEGSKRCILGPPTMLDKTDAETPLRLAFEPFTLVNANLFDRVAVIIDIGIAFWNTRFRSGTTQDPDSRFRAMRYLNFDALLTGKTPFGTLNEVEIAKFCGIANQAGGSDIVAAQIGRLFPDCYFDHGGGGVPDALWHGTATADLMAGLPLSTPDKTALFGIELPMKVLRDADGDTLTEVLSLLIEAAVEMTANFADKPLTIMLAWGFSAGLQDGTHPAAKAIQDTLAAHTDRIITLMLPTGNQLQDKCCARLTPSETPVAQQVVWQVPPDDFSANTIELFVRAPAPSGVQTIKIGPPSQGAFVIAIKENHWAVILRGAQIVGLLFRFPDSASNARLRLTLAPTGWQYPDQLPAPAGDWKLCFARQDDVSLWILRDDRDVMLDGPLPRRMSAFFDPSYSEHDALGDYVLEDNPTSAVVRSGTVSVLATTKVKAPTAAQAQPLSSAVIVVQANEQMIGNPERQAFYSGRRADGQPIEKTALVDWGRQSSGVQSAANGTAQRVRITGSSAAVAIYARRHLGIPPDLS